MELEGEFLRPSESIISALNETLNQCTTSQKEFYTDAGNKLLNFSNLLAQRDNELGKALNDAINKWSADTERVSLSIGESLKEISEEHSQIGTKFVQMAEQSIDEYDISKALTDALKFLEPPAGLYSDVALEQIGKSCSEFFKNMDRFESPLSQITKSALSAISNDTRTESSLGDNISAEEFLEALEEQECDPDGFKEQFSKKPEKWHKDFTTLKQVIIYVMIGILIQLSSDAVEEIGQTVVTYFQCNVKECPKNDGEIIGILPKGTEAIIADDENYYYKIYFTDENGEEKEGYVAKRNVEIVEEKKQSSD